MHSPYQPTGDRKKVFLRTQWSISSATMKASEMISFIRNYAKEKGLSRLELNMWELNEDALAFYEEVEFKTYRRYMEMML